MAKTPHFGKIVAFTAFDENHSFHDFRDYLLSLVMRLHVICPPIRLSVMFRYCDHTGWNTSKIISGPNSLRSLLTLIPTWAIWCNGNTPKIRVE